MSTNQGEDRIGVVLKEMLSVSPATDVLSDPARFREKGSRRKWPLSAIDGKKVGALAAAILLVTTLLAAGPLRSGSRQAAHVRGVVTTTTLDSQQADIEFVQRLIAKVGDYVSTAEQGTSPNNYENADAAARSARAQLNFHPFPSTFRSEVSALSAALETLSTDAVQAATSADLSMVAGIVQNDYSKVLTARDDLVQSMG